MKIVQYNKFHYPAVFFFCVMTFLTGITHRGVMNFFGITHVCNDIFRYYTIVCNDIFGITHVCNDIFGITHLCNDIFRYYTDL